MDCTGPVLAIRTRSDGTGKVCFKSGTNASNGNWQCMGTNYDNEHKNFNLALLLTAKNLEKDVSWKQSPTSTTCYTGQQLTFSFWNWFISLLKV